MKHVFFFENEPPHEKNPIFIEINHGSKNDLLSEVKMKLHFPSYFGMNWDAFVDCFRETIHNTKNNKLVIIHKNHPLKNREEFEKYTTILDEVIDEFQSADVEVYIKRVQM